LSNSALLFGEQLSTIRQHGSSLGGDAASYPTPGRCNLAPSEVAANAEGCCWEGGARQRRRPPVTSTGTCDAAMSSGRRGSRS